MSELEGKIEECIAELKPYVMFSPDANNAIKGLEQLKEQLKNLTKENIDEVLRGVDEGYRGSLAYSNYIPKTVENLRFIKEWLENKKASM
jgi:thermostable 8-oxoguanine DNA glycosylase